MYVVQKFWSIEFWNLRDTFHLVFMLNASHILSGFYSFVIVMVAVLIIVHLFMI